MINSGVKIKVCGMREEKNINDISSLPIDFMGLIFYPKSSRFIDQDVPETKIPKVGVFVNEEISKIQALNKKYNLKYVQLHGDETPEYCAKIKVNGFKVIKAFRVDDAFDFNLTQKYEATCDYFLFDAKGKEYGGNGIVFHWNLLNKYKGKIPFFLSGGITEEAIESINEFKHDRLFAVDINSGFELKPALKDAKKIQQFIQGIKKI